MCTQVKIKMFCFEIWICPGNRISKQGKYSEILVLFASIWFTGAVMCLNNSHILVWLTQIAPHTMATKFS